MKLIDFNQNVSIKIRSAREIHLLKLKNEIIEIEQNWEIEIDWLKLRNQNELILESEHQDEECWRNGSGWCRIKGNNLQGWLSFK